MIIELDLLLLYVVTLLVIISIAIFSVVSFLQTRNFNKAKKLIRKREQHLKDEHNIVSYDCLDDELTAITRRGDNFVEVTSAKNQKKIRALAKSKKILKKGINNFEMLSKNDLERIKELIK